MNFDDPPVSWGDKSERIKHKHLLAAVSIWSIIGFGIGYIVFG